MYIKRYVLTGSDACNEFIAAFIVKCLLKTSYI